MSNEQPGLIASHLSYLQGSAESAIGSVLGSDDWKSAGSKIQDQAVNDMRTASNATSNPQSGSSPTLGSIESTIGKAVGCEGMVDEGTKRQ